MARESVLNVRYIGVFPHIGHREYRFQIEAEDKSFRTVSLTIDNAIFRKKLLMYQEAPNLCYQKMLAIMQTRPPFHPFAAKRLYRR